MVGLLGSRQVGKTTLAKLLQKKSPHSLYLDLELDSDLNKLREPELYLREQADKLVVIDEIQRLPQLFPLIRALVDQKRRNGRFLLLGSASVALARGAAESLAGRINFHELSPFLLAELPRQAKNWRQLWLRGGYPRSFLAPSAQVSLEWRTAFLRAYLERDLPQLGIRVPAAHLRRFLLMLAHHHGQLWNASQIGGSLGVSAPTAKHYLDILAGTFLVRELPPYAANLKKRLVKTAKVYYRDSGILHALLNLKNFEDLLAHPILGHSWEGFVIEQISALLPIGFEAYFYRTADGTEIDLLLTKNSRPEIAIEIKHSLSPQPAKRFFLASRDLQCRRNFVVYPGTEKYTLAKNLTALPISRLEDIFGR